MQLWSLGQEDPLEEGMATHSSMYPGKMAPLPTPHAGPVLQASVITDLLFKDAGLSPNTDSY